VRALSRFWVTPAPESGDKLTRFGPFSWQYRAGNVKIRRGSWTAGPTYRMAVLSRHSQAFSIHNADAAYFGPIEAIAEFFGMIESGRCGWAQQ